MCTMRSACLGSLLFLVSQASRVQVEEHSKFDSEASTAIEDNQYVLAWTNRFGPDAAKVMSKSKGEFVVPVKCKEGKGVWLKVSDVAVADSRALTTHCVTVTCKNTGEVDAEIGACPGGYSGHGEVSGTRVISTGDAYFMKKGYWSTSTWKDSDNGYTVMFPDTSSIHGRATDDDVSDRGLEVYATDMNVKANTFTHWATNLKCKQTLSKFQNPAELPWPRNAASMEACKGKAERVQQECLKEADDMEGKSAWWFKFVYFPTYGRKRGNTFDDVGQKYEACKEFSNEATEEEWTKRGKDKRAEKASFALFGQSWEYQCQEALDAEAAGKRGTCASKAWWCESKDVAECMAETWLPELEK